MNLTDYDRDSISNCASKQTKAMVSALSLYWCNQKDGVDKWPTMDAVKEHYEDLFDEEISEYTCYIATQKCKEYFTELGQIIAFIRPAKKKAPVVTQQMAYEHFRKKKNFGRKWYLGQRSDLIGLLAVAFRVRETVDDVILNSDKSKDQGMILKLSKAGYLKKAA